MTPYTSEEPGTNKNSVHHLPKCSKYSTNIGFTRWSSGQHYRPKRARKWRIGPNHPSETIAACLLAQIRASVLIVHSAVSAKSGPTITTTKCDGYCSMSPSVTRSDLPDRCSDERAYDRTNGAICAGEVKPWCNNRQQDSQGAAPKKRAPLLIVVIKMVLSLDKFYFAFRKALAPAIMIVEQMIKTNVS